MDQVNDCELMFAVARQRDVRAFEELYRRYERLAFAVAYHVSGSREVAEEAVQQGMLRIWNRAECFDPAGNLRAWIGRLVTREAQMVLRTRRRHVRKENHFPNGCAEELAVSGRQAEGADWIPEFHKAFSLLPPLERQLLTMYYAAGLTQTEMARELAIPQRTVSHKLDAALQVLRTNLAKAGFSAALPAATAKVLGEALCSGLRIPAGLHDKVLKSLAHPYSEVPSRDASLKGAATPTGSPVLLAAGVMLAVSVAGAAWWASQPTRDGTPSGVAERGRDPSVLSALVTPPGKGASARFPARWTFEDGPPRDLVEFPEGKKWRWRPGRLGKGEMFVAGPLPGMSAAARLSAWVNILIPQELPRAPFVVTAEVYLPKDQYGFFGLDGYWTDLRGDLPYRRWRTTKGVQSPPSRISVFFVGPYILQRVNRRTVTISEYRVPYPTKRVLLSIERITVTVLELRMLAPGEMDEELVDIPQAIRRLRLMPAEIPGNPYPAH